MTIKAGSILVVAGATVLDRIQSAGPGLSIPEEKINEVGNNEGVAIVRDIPDLTFDMETLDVSTEPEAILLGLAPGSITAGQELDLQNAVPIDVISPFVSSSLVSVRGVIVPYLQLESATYRYGVGQNSTESFTLRGDAIYYVPGTPHYEEIAATGGAGPFSFTEGTAIVTREAGNDVYALCVTVERVDGTYERLVFGSDYSNTNSGFTLTAAGIAKAPSGATLHVVYGSATTETYGAGVHEGVAVKPAAVRGKDVDVYLSDGAATPSLVRLEGLQSAEVSWRLNAEATQELGNHHTVERSYDTADLTGSLGMKPKTAQYLFDIVTQITGTTSGEIVNALNTTELEMQIRISNPDTGAVIKTLLIDDARFTPASIQPRANTRLETTLSFGSDSGVLKVVKGTPL